MQITGLYQLLNPNSSKLFGYNVFKLSGICQVLYLGLIILMCIVSIYYTVYDFTEVIKYMMLIIATFFALIKMYFIIRNSDALWKCMNFTSLNYLSYRGHQKSILTEAQASSSMVTNTFTLVWMVGITVWILSPIIISENYLKVKSKDNTYNQYRYNMLNLIFPVTASFYNDNFHIFFFIETLALIFWGYSTMIFDNLVLSMCITIKYQLKMIALSYSELGHRDIEINFESK